MNDTSSRSALEAALAQITERTLSRGERAGHLAMTIFAAVGGLAMVGLLVTETGLPLRTNIAIGVLAVIAASWTIFGLRVLSRSHPLLANREVVAGRMALLFSALFTGGTMAVGLVNAGILVTPATWLGATMTAVAAANLARAQWRRAQLRALRERLERELLGSA
jgi:hypothetical protein